MGVTHREVMPTVEPLTTVYANNRVAISHQPTRQQDSHSGGFSSARQAQRFLTLPGLTQNHFRLGRPLLQAVNYRLWRTQAFQVWKESVGAEVERETLFSCDRIPLNGQCLCKDLKTLLSCVICCYCCQNYLSKHKLQGKLKPKSQCCRHFPRHSDSKKNVTQ